MIKIKINEGVFTAAGSSMFVKNLGYPTQAEYDLAVAMAKTKAVIVVGRGLMANGAVVGVVESEHMAPMSFDGASRAQKPNTYLNITLEGTCVPDKSFHLLSFESYKSGLADLMRKNIITVSYATDGGGTPVVLSVGGMLNF
jgi:hypothetical protein